jgi:hypothetical protein
MDLFIGLVLSTLATVGLLNKLGGEKHLFFNNHRDYFRSFKNPLRKKQ